MYPVLFSIGPVSVDTYYVFWGAALIMAVTWIRRRCVSLYGISYDDASDVLIWVIFGVFIGATLGGYLDHWKRYADNPAEALRFWRSGLSSGPGFLGGGLAGIWKLRKLRASVGDFAEASALPCAFMLALGRIGCFMAGCCGGLPVSPDNPSPVLACFSAVTYPTQIMESAASLVIGLLLAAVERRRGSAPGRPPLLWPLFLILYGSYRVVFDVLRAGDRILGLRVGQYAGAVAIIVGAVWIIYARSGLGSARDEA